MIIRFKGGPGSGHFGHSGRPGLRGGSLPGKVISEATEYSWKAEDTIIMRTVIETTDKITDEELTEIAMAAASEKFDIEDASLKDVDWQQTRDGFYAHVTVDLTPTEEAGEQWAEGGAYEEEFETWHE